MSRVQAGRLRKKRRGRVNRGLQRRGLNVVELPDVAEDDEVARDPDADLALRVARCRVGARGEAAGRGDVAALALREERRRDRADERA